MQPFYTLALVSAEVVRINYVKIIINDFISKICKCTSEAVFFLAQQKVKLSVEDGGFFQSSEKDLDFPKESFSRLRFCVIILSRFSSA